MNSTTIAIDVAKSVFEVAISEQPGQVRERKRLSREQFRQFLAERPAATILMEACGSAHHWARLAQAHGHQAVLVPPHVVRPMCCVTRPTAPMPRGCSKPFATRMSTRCQ